MRRFQWCHLAQLQGYICIAYCRQGPKLRIENQSSWRRPIMAVTMAMPRPQPWSRPWSLLRAPAQHHGPIRPNQTSVQKEWGHARSIRADRKWVVPLEHRGRSPHVAHGIWPNTMAGGCFPKELKQSIQRSIATNFLVLKAVACRLFLRPYSKQPSTRLEENTDCPLTQTCAHAPSKSRKQCMGLYVWANMCATMV